MHPHEYERGGTAKLLTLFRPATGLLRAKGVLSAPNAVLHPWLKGELTEVLAEIEKKQPAESLPPKRSARCMRSGKRGWVILPATPPCHHYASCWSWIIWQGTCPVIWCSGSLSMA
ncbi:hypothetical protein KSD_80920 [Ktedonobacter sp. SOSP1-85]|uniref:hypothetical protein n=1 Tax=Ktedonobacter sp. SOSP1-85 TaxID=2778367 RepID=UPI001A1DA269|nr:hypothetical protein [Ktedonobacter sp. SOSP1-85]GHO80321.1 hypothetical protein KSD_80920 [Ktedonobacter sp. SOSP1-85]